LLPSDPVQRRLHAVELVQVRVDREVEIDSYPIALWIHR